MVMGALTPLIQHTGAVEKLGYAAAQGELSGAQAAAMIDQASPTARAVIRLIAADPVVCAWLTEFLNAPQKGTIN